MGLNFIRKAAPSYRKGLDRRRIELCTPTLFTQQPTGSPRGYAASLRSGQDLHAGEQVCVHLNGQEEVLVLRGLDPVAVLTSPPRELIEALGASFGEAGGVVQEVHKISGTAEIAVC
jgi:hypothetical protein